MGAFIAALPMTKQPSQFSPNLCFLAVRPCQVHCSNCLNLWKHAMCIDIGLNHARTAQIGWAGWIVQASQCSPPWGSECLTWALIVLLLTLYPHFLLCSLIVSPIVYVSFLTQERLDPLILKEHRETRKPSFWVNSCLNTTLFYYPIIILQIWTLPFHATMAKLSLCQQLWAKPCNS